jgi:hypothetical protein
MMVKTDSGDSRPTDKWCFKFLIHNVFIHPIAGIFWFLGFGDLGNRIHETCKPN